MPEFSEYFAQILLSSNVLKLLSLKLPLRKCCVLEGYEATRGFAATPEPFVISVLITVYNNIHMSI